MGSNLIGKKGLETNSLKLIAIIAMTIDHLAILYFADKARSPLEVLFHFIGRITAPIIWFFIAEGCYHTHNIRRYRLRLLSFAIISHFAYNFAFGFFGRKILGHIPFTSIMFPLYVSVLIISIMKSGKVSPKFGVFLAFIACVITYYTDWSFLSVFATVLLYRHRGSFELQAWDIFFVTVLEGFLSILPFFYLGIPVALIEAETLGMLLSIPLLACYNGNLGTIESRRNQQIVKMSFYVYYPLHLFLIGLARIMLYGDFPIA